MLQTIRQLGLFKDIPTKTLQREKKPRQLVGRVLHLGAGVQSSCIAEMIIEGTLPRVDLVVFCDTGNEPVWVYAQVKYLQKRFASVGIPFAITKKKDSQGIIEDTQALTQRFASMPLWTRNPKTGRVGRLRRQCTKEYKIEPSDDYLRDWLLKHGHATLCKNGSRRIKPSVYVENWYGISADETYRAGKRGGDWQKAVYPLINGKMTRNDCVKWLLHMGLPVPKKSSCIVCPYHDNNYWTMLKSETPDAFDEACRFDEWLRSEAALGTSLIKSLKQPVYLHQSCKPLREVDFADRRPMDMFAVELVEGATCASDGGFSCMS